MIDKSFIVSLIIGILCLGITGNLWAGGTPVILDRSLTQKQLGRHTDYIEDVHHQFSIHTIQGKKEGWTPSQQDNFNFGFSNSVYWFRFPVTNDATQPISWYLEVAYPQLDNIQLYYPNGTGALRMKQTGDRFPFDTRDLNYRTFLFTLDTPPGTHFYFLRIQSTSSFSFPLVMWKPTICIDHKLNELVILMIFYGIMLVMTVYNFFIFITVREKAYLNLVLFIFSYSMLQFILNGFAFQYLWPHSMWWANNSIPVFIYLGVLFTSETFRSYIQTDTHYPKINKLAIYFTLLCAIGAVTSLLGHYKFSSLSACLLAIISYFFIFIFSFYAWRKGSRPAIFVALSFSCYLWGGSLFAFKTIGVLPLNPITHWSMQIGSSLLVILLSFGLADKINVMKSHLQQLNVNLETMVEKRTAQLQTALDDIASKNDQLMETRDELWGEMQLARKLQTILLPKYPRMKGFEVSCYMKSADSVGGDYYDIINTDTHDWVVIGDVSGHGVSAGLVMMMAQTAITTVINHNPHVSPHRLLEIINQTISSNIKRLSDDKYMTITVAAAYDKGRFVFSGLHQDIFIYRSASKTIDEIETTGMWIGIVDDVSGMVKDDCFKVDPGDTILFFTDGLTEAKDRAGNMFSTEQLQSVFAGVADQSTEIIKKRLVSALDHYCPDDDITFMAIKCTADTPAKTG